MWEKDANEMAEGAHGGNPGAGLQISCERCRDPRANHPRTHTLGTGKGRKFWEVVLLGTRGRQEWREDREQAR